MLLGTSVQALLIHWWAPAHPSEHHSYSQGCQCTSVLHPLSVASGLTLQASQRFKGGPSPCVFDSPSMLLGTDGSASFKWPLETWNQNMQLLKTFRDDLHNYLSDYLQLVNRLPRCMFEKFDGEQLMRAGQGFQLRVSLHSI